MYQLPVRAKSADPQNLGTAACSLFCHCDDGNDYAVKNSASGAHVAHSEWFCKHLGDQVGLASPECRWVEVAGEVAFGSRWESGHDPENWWVRVQSGEIEKDRVAPTISRILAFDLFVNNEDRHAANYIVRPQMNDQWSFLAFDHSHAWRPSGWPLPDPPMDVSVTTLRNFQLINNMLGSILDVAESLFVISKIREVKADMIARILDTQHVSWLSEQERDDTLSYWQGAEFNQRVDKIEEGFRNGDYV